MLRDFYRFSTCLAIDSHIIVHRSCTAIQINDHIKNWWDEGIRKLSYKVPLYRENHSTTIPYFFVVVFALSSSSYLTTIMKVANFNGCKVYNLSTGKTMPDWLTQSKKRALQKDEEYRKRLELIQEFEMTTAAQCIGMSKDYEHIIVTGTYPPIVKCFTTSDLALKFQRGLTAEVVAMQILSDDYGKLVFLQNDRTINIHAPYGTHYSLRIPKFGRDMKYNWDNCDLLISSSSNEIYRLNLESGQFREPFIGSFTGCNKLHVNPVHQLIGCAGDSGLCEFWDPRQRKRVALLEINDHLLNGINTTQSSHHHHAIGSSATPTHLTAIKFDTDGLTLGIGTSNGNCYMYDIRSQKPFYVKEHQYGLPIVDISYHHTTKSIITTDKKIVKIWDRNPATIGKIMTNIETPCEINDILFVKDQRGETGLIMIPGEQSRVMTYFIPQLGPAPRWCSFLENLTEELEENASSNIYEDYKFITKAELEELGATSLLGTPMLKAYMHGFFIEMKLYNKLRAVSKPFEYEEYRKQKIREKIEANRSSRISVSKKLPKVNQQLAEKLIQKEMKKIEEDAFHQTAEESQEKKNKKTVIDAKKLIDPRFAAIFEREEFQQDENDYEYQLKHPVKAKITKEKLENQKKSKYAEDSEDEKDNLFEEIGEVSDDGTEVSEDGEDNPDEYNELVSSSSDERNSEEESERPRKRKGNYGGGDDEEEMGAIEKSSMKAKLKKMMKQNELENKNKKMKMFTLNDSIKTEDVLFGNKKSLKALQKEERSLSNLPLNQRLSQPSYKSNDRSKGKTKNRRNNSKQESTQIKFYKNKDEGMIREISFIPNK